MLLKHARSEGRREGARGAVKKGTGAARGGGSGIPAVVPLRAAPAGPAREGPEPVPGSCSR